MSASEKLRALDAVRENAPMGWSMGPAHAGSADWDELSHALIAALPQIVAVVEAAEAASGEIQSGAPSVQNTLDAALSALDEALS